MGELGAMLVPCAGRAERWAGHLGLQTKALIPVGNLETVGSRLVRLCRELAPEARIVMLLGDESVRFGGAECTLARPGDFPCDVDKLSCTRPYWSACADSAIVYGDVYLSRAAAAAILSPEPCAGVTWFGRKHPNPHTGKRRSELYALRFAPVAHAYVAGCCAAVRQQFRRGSSLTCCGWTVLAHMRQQPPPGPLRLAFASIVDRTEDFDFPSDYTTWLQKQAGAAATQCSR
jgi:hypothetical protein